MRDDNLPGVEARLYGVPLRRDAAVAELDRRRDNALAGLQRSSEQTRATFRARLRAASYSRREMADVMAETLAALGYDVSEWTTAHSLNLRDEPQFTKSDLEEAKDEGYSAGQSDGPSEDDLVAASDEGYDRGVKYVRDAVERALESL